MANRSLKFSAEGKKGRARVRTRPSVPQNLRIRFPSISSKRRERVNLGRIKIALLFTMNGALGRCVPSARLWQTCRDTSLRFRSPASTHGRPSLIDIRVEVDLSNSGQALGFPREHYLIFSAGTSLTTLGAFESKGYLPPYKRRPIQRVASEENVEH
jgi:hypothetical protein